MRTIYLDNAATTMKKPAVVKEAVLEAFDRLGNAGRGSSAAAGAAASSVFRAREGLAELFHAEGPDRISFTCNATESLNLAIKGVFEPGDHVITTASEHNSVLRPLYEMEKKGVSLTILPADAKGRIDYDEMEAAIRPETKGIVCQHGSNVTGNQIDLERVGALASERGLLFIADASQTAGAFPIDVQRMQIGMLCFTGHKSLYGPQGTGGIYVKEGICVRPLKSGGSGFLSFLKEHPGKMPEALEAGTLNGHGIAGLGAAVSWILEQDPEALGKRECALAALFEAGIRDLPGVMIYGDREAENRCPIVSMNLGTYESALISDELEQRFGILTRAGAHCAPLLHRALGTEKQGAVRFSFSSMNTEEEVREAIRAVRILSREGMESV